MKKHTGASILSIVREKMREASVKALIVPTADAHNSEYPAAHLNKRAFMSNFHGSAGTVVVTEREALLWTDGRYWLEAADSLYPEYTLMKQGKEGTPDVGSWLRRELGAEAAVGVDPYVYTMAAWKSLREKVALQAVGDLVGPLMEPPAEAAVSAAAVYERPLQYCGQSRQEKRAAVVEALRAAGCELTVLSALDEVAWLTNLRGGDVAHNPVFYSYALVDAARPAVRLYVDPAKVSAELRASVGGDVEFVPYGHMEADVAAAAAGRRVLVDAQWTSEAVRRLLVDCGAAVEAVDLGPVQSLKAHKTAAELEGARACHVRDGAALTRYLAWLQQEVVERGATVTEFAGAERLEQFRAEDSLFVQLSFTTISSSGANGAVIHYSPPAEGSSVIARGALYLVDSGAQYWDGTTDVTRTVCFDAPTAEEREFYTRVLQGHAALSSLVFPCGTAGVRLDAVARLALWRAGLDYAHGTGHGVGSFLCVHEGPFGIGVRPVPSGGVLGLGCIVSNEPGFYADGRFGIRIENLEEVVASPTAHSPEGFLGFRSLTRAPLCRDLIEPALLSEEERRWVDAYHATVREALEPLLTACGDDLALRYLHYHTEPMAAW